MALKIKFLRSFFKNKLVTTNCHLICFSIWNRLLSNISNLQLKSHISKSMQIFVNMNLYMPLNSLWCLSVIYYKLISLKSSAVFEIFCSLYDYRKCFRDFSLQNVSFEISWWSRPLRFVCFALKHYANVSFHHLCLCAMENISKQRRFLHSDGLCPNESILCCYITQAFQKTPKRGS